MAQSQRAADVHQDELCPPKKDMLLWMLTRRTIFHLPQATDNNHDHFVPAPKFSKMVPFHIKNLGFTLELRSTPNGRIVRIKRLLDDLRVTAAKVCVTAAKHKLVFHLALLLDKQSVNCYKSCGTTWTYLMLHYTRIRKYAAFTPKPPLLSCDNPLLIRRTVFWKTDLKFFRKYAAHPVCAPVFLKTQEVKIDQGLGSTSCIRACALRNFDLEVMEFENTQNNALAKLPMLKLEEYEMWEIRIKQYFHIQDYALWEIYSTSHGTNPIDDQLTFDQYVDAQSMFTAIKARFGGNEATKKTQKALLKQQYENFSASSLESLDSSLNRLQKLVSRLAILGVVTPPEDLNVKFLRSLPSEWDTTCFIWYDKPILRHWFDDQYTIFKSLTEALHDDDLEEMDLKWNMALLSMRARKFYQRTRRKIIIDGGNTAGYDKSKAMCAIECVGFDWSAPPHGIGRDPMQTWLLMAFSESEITEKSKKGVGYNAVPSPHPLILNRPTTLDLSYSGLEEFKEPEENTDDSLETTSNTDTQQALLSLPLKVDKDWKEKVFLSYWVSDDEEQEFAQEDGSKTKPEKKTVIPTATKIEKPVRKPVKYDEMYRSQIPRGNQRNWNAILTKQRKRISNSQLNDKGFVDSGCSRHMTGNIAHLSDFKDFDGGYVTFGGGAYGGRITGKGIQGVSESSTSSQQDQDNQDCIVMPIWKDASYFGDAAPRSVADAQIQDKDGLQDENDATEKSHDDSSLKDNVNTATPEDLVGPSHASEDTQVEDQEVELGNIPQSYAVPTTPHTRIHKDHPIEHVIGDVQSSVQTRRMKTSYSKQGFLSAIYEGKTHQDLHTCLFACFLSQEEPKRVSKALSDPAWVEAMQEELLQFKLQKVWILVDLPKGHRGNCEQSGYTKIRRKRGLSSKQSKTWLAQGHTQEEGIDYNEVFAPVARIKAIRIHYLGSTEEGVTGPATEKKKGIFISQDKYVHEILRKYNYTDVKSASTPTDLEKPLVQDGDAAEVDEHLYRSMLGSLMYLIASRPDIMINHLELVAYTDNDYTGATQDRKSTTGGCQFLGNRLISWQCKKQTVVATSTTEAEYVAGASCCGPVL
ncbi:putative ribonuclease H-like domain-containing protein [Tanacetum coccineum]|uniref:Ribonuclease H-like domain-containing protein n=1 Tax=Tanacetum coccineum TaxID=301880 RepID=A0ABQ5GVJ7_9ASTR